MNVEPVAAAAVRVRAVPGE
jgi:hypothetical protein